MAVVGNELVTSVGNSLCAWDLRQLSAGGVCFVQQMTDGHICHCPRFAPQRRFRGCNQQRPWRGSCNGITHWCSLAIVPHFMLLICILGNRSGVWGHFAQSEKL